MRNVLAGVLIGFIVIAAAAQTENQVIRYFESLQSLRADFTQTVFDEQNNAVQSSAGKVFMQRPWAVSLGLS